MAQRTFAIGDIHGETKHLYKLMSCLPKLDAEDTLVFLGDYIDRGPASAEVVEFVRTLHQKTPAKVVALRGNHEDAWLRVLDRGWDEFVTPPGNGCLAAYRSFVGGPVPREDELPQQSEAELFTSGEFFPKDGGGLVSQPSVLVRGRARDLRARRLATRHRGLHPPERGARSDRAACGCATIYFFRNYRGKLVVFGHTRTEYLPPELSGYTPEDPTDLWAGENVVGIDTGCGNGGFLTAFELPAMNVYESRD